MHRSMQDMHAPELEDHRIFGGKTWKDIIKIWLVLNDDNYSTRYLSEVNLKIPEFKAYNEDVLMMVMNYSRYGDSIPFVIGTIHTHAALEVITDDEWTKLGNAWKSAALPAFAS